MQDVDEGNRFDAVERRGELIELPYVIFAPEKVVQAFLAGVNCDNILYVQMNLGHLIALSDYIEGQLREMKSLSGIRDRVLVKILSLLPNGFYDLDVSYSLSKLEEFSGEVKVALHAKRASLGVD